MARPATRPVLDLHAMSPPGERVAPSHLPRDVPSSPRQIAANAFGARRTVWLGLRHGDQRVREVGEAGGWGGGDAAR